MNKFTEKSFALAARTYLDDLHYVYPIQENEIRLLSEQYIEKLREAFDSNDDLELFKLLLNNKETKKLPIKDSYIPFFSRSNDLENHLEQNPETISRIIGRIKKEGFEKMIEGMQAPIESNRQMGQAFRNWLKTKYLSHNNMQSFLDSSDSVSILDMQDVQAVIEVRKCLGLEIEGLGSSSKGLDLVMKVIKKDGTPHYIIGEAKFLTDEGGHQNAQLKDALDLLTANMKNPNSIPVTRVAILDGVCWIDKETKMQKEIKALRDDQIALSALLLDALIQEIITE